MSYYDKLENQASAHAAERAWQEYQDDIAATPACACIRAIREIDLTPGVLRQILAALSARAAKANFAHVDEAVAAVEYLDDAQECFGRVA